MHLSKISTTLFRQAAVCVAGLLTLVSIESPAQCPVNTVAIGLKFPLSIVRTGGGQLFVSETGDGTPRSGRISIVDPRSGQRRTFLSGLPSAINDVGEPAGPSGLFLRGNTLYVAIGIGDTIVPGPVAGTALPNPSGASSRLFSSVLAITFTDLAARFTQGYTLTKDDEANLASNGSTFIYDGFQVMSIEVVANFPDFRPAPNPLLPANVSGSNPFDLVAAGDHLYVTDGGQNQVWDVYLTSRVTAVLATFPPIANPFFNPGSPDSIGGPFVEAVPTGITRSGRNLLVTLFRGFPFPPLSQVVSVDRSSGAVLPVHTGLKTAIDVKRVGLFREDQIVLQHYSNRGPFFMGAGSLIRFGSLGPQPITIANCLEQPTSMAVDRRAGAVYITELAQGRVVSVPMPY